MNQSNRRSGPSAHRSSRLLAGVIAAIAVVGGMLVSPPAAEAATQFVTPVTGRIGDIVDGCPAGSRPTHQGVDVNQNANAIIYSIAAGTVTTAVNSQATTGYGSQVVITHADGYTSRYAHMVFGSVTLKVGAKVPQGATLGRVGSTGNSTGAHLHFELLRNGANLTNTYFSCGQRNITALSPMLPRPSTSVNADVNGDSRADLIALSTAGRMVVYNGNGKGGWATVTLGSGWGSTRALVHGDFTGDGRGDLAAVRNDGNLWFYRGVGKNSFTASLAGAGWNSARLVAGGADFNGDGRMDLVSIAADGYLYLHSGNGDGTFASPIRIDYGWDDVNVIVVGDFNLDGIGDVVGRDSGGRLLLASGNGSGVNPRVQIGNGWSGMTTITGGADFNSDKYPDLIARDAVGNLWLYPWRGSTFGSKIKVGNGWNVHRLIH